MEEGFMHSLVVFVRVVRVVGRGVEVFRVDLVGSRVGIHEDGVGLRALGGKGMGEPAVVVGERWVGTCSHEDRNHVRPLLVGSHMERSVSRLFVHNVGRRTLVNQRLRNVSISLRSSIHQRLTSVSTAVSLFVVEEENFAFNGILCVCSVLCCVWVWEGGGRAYGLARDVWAV